jgi:pyruvate-ferredoxin/flavodoxin oxidoreductase
MAKAVFDEFASLKPKNGFTVGIDDDVSHTSLDRPRLRHRAATTVRALFYGLGADGTVGANKNSVKILAEDEGMYAQGYFVYDSHKSGAETISHLRFGGSRSARPTSSESADFVACHKFVS